MNGIESIVKRSLDPKHFSRFLHWFDGGKRLRPMMMEEVCRFLRKDFGHLMNAAAAIEILHCASLIHDDILDIDTERRGRRSFHSKFGLNDGILFGDYLASKAYHVFLEGDYPARAQKAFSMAVSEMIEGQMMELSGITKDAYAEYAGKKTASLFVLAAEIPLIVYHIRDDKVLEFARDFGIAFQIANDIRGGSKENSILSFMGMAEARKVLEENIKKLDSMRIFDTGKMLRL